MANKFEDGSTSFNKISMDQIIGAPLRATANANATMASEQVKFMLEYCFVKNGNNLEPIMIEMSLTSSKMDRGEDDSELQLKQINTKFSLPLITIIPLNSLSVTDFEIDFDMEVTSVESDETSSKSTVSPISDGSKQEKIQLMGKVSSKSEQSRSSNSQYQRKVESKLSVNVKGGQMPLPVGVTTILDIYKNNIEPIEIKVKK